MKLSALFFGVMLLATPLGAETSASDTRRVTASDPQAMVKLLQDMGYRAELTKDNQGDPKINSAAGGSKFGILFYNCTKNVDCRAIQFYSGFDLEKGSTLQLMNDWNTDKRFGKAYLDSENDPYLELDLNLDFGGISEDAFRDTVDTWEQLVSGFKEHIDW